MSMNDDIKKYPVYALSQQGLIPIEITSVNDYNHQTHQLHHYIRQGAYNGNKEWYDKRGIEQKLILMPNYVHLIVHNSPTGANVTDEQFLKKFKINRCDLLFNRRKWRDTMIKDLTNKKFNRLKVLKLAYIKNNRAFWECECECGNIKVVRSDNLQKGTIKSCGCLHSEISGKRFYRHGFCGTKIYKCWESMKARCTNLKTPGYKDYGGRGITICDEWFNDFMNFYNWAIANGYDDSLSIDRIDVNGNYEPSNCRWITMKEQAKNKRSCHYISYNGKTHCISEWLEILEIKNRTIANKLYNGYPLEKIIKQMGFVI